MSHNILRQEARAGTNLTYMTAFENEALVQAIASDDREHPSDAEIVGTGLPGSTTRASRSIDEILSLIFSISIMKRRNLGTDKCIPKKLA